MSKRSAQKIVNQLVSLGFLERTHQIGKNGEQGSNLYKVTIWHLANVPEPSIDRRGKSCTPAKDSMPLEKNLHPPIAKSATKLDINKLDTNKLNKNKKNNYTEAFNTFWLKYTKMNFEKSVSQSKKPAFVAWQKLPLEVKDKLCDYLQADLNERLRKKRKEEWVPMFPDCHRWISKGQYEQFLDLATSKKLANIRKPSEEIPEGCPF